MDDSRFDGLARALASSRTRRGYLAAAIGFLGASALAVRGTTDASQVGCRGEGESCALNSACCLGQTCVRLSAFNPNVGVCQPGSVDPTRSPLTPTPRPTSTPTSTPGPSPTPTATPRPGEVVRVPMTVSLDCDTPGQSITFSTEQDLPIDIVSIRTFLGQGRGGAGPRLSWEMQRVTWRWGCRQPGVGNCRSGPSDPLFSIDQPGRDGVVLRIRFERLACDAEVACIERSNPDGILRCIRR